MSLILALAVASSAPQQRIERLTPEQLTLAPIAVKLDAIPLASLVTILMRDVMRVPYVIAPDVLSDRRPISVNLIIPRNRVPEHVVGFLRRNGLSADLVGGTVFVARQGGPVGTFQAVPQMFAGSTPNMPMGSPFSPAPAVASAPIADIYSSEKKPPRDPEGDFAARDGKQILAYIPAHRDPPYLAELVGAVLPVIQTAARGDVKADPDRQAILDRFSPDVLVMAGARHNLDRARKLLAVLDRPRPVVNVRAAILQVRESHSRGSALSALVNIAGGRVQLGRQPDAPAFPQFVKLAAGGVRAVLSAIRSDGRFKVLASPNLAAVSGGGAVINAGEEVPTVGQVTLSENGQPLQSVLYRESGVTLSVRPIVRGDLIELDVKEERSNFVRTTTGVAASPTLQKSTATSQVVIKSGESVVLAGLDETAESNTRDGLLGGLLGSRQRERSKGELLIVLEAELAPSPGERVGQFVDIDAQLEADECSPIVDRTAIGGQPEKTSPEASKAARKGVHGKPLCLPYDLDGEGLAEPRGPQRSEDRTAQLGPASRASGGAE